MSETVDLLGLFDPYRRDAVLDQIGEAAKAAAADAITHRALQEIGEDRCLLTSRECFVLLRRFGIYDGHNWMLESVGKELNVTRERVRQIEARAIRKLRLGAERGERD